MQTQNNNHPLIKTALEMWEELQKEKGETEKISPFLNININEKGALKNGTRND